MFQSTQLNFVFLTGVKSLLNGVRICFDVSGPGRFPHLVVPHPPGAHERQCLRSPSPPSAPAWPGPGSEPGGGGAPGDPGRRGPTLRSEPRDPHAGTRQDVGTPLGAEEGGWRRDPGGGEDAPDEGPRPLAADEASPKQPLPGLPPAPAPRTHHVPAESRAPGPTPSAPQPEQCRRHPRGERARPRP